MLIPTMAGGGGLSHSCFISEEPGESSPGLCVQLVQGTLGPGFEPGTSWAHSPQLMWPRQALIWRTATQPAPTSVAQSAPTSYLPLTGQEAGHVLQPMPRYFRGKGHRFSPAFQGQG